MHKNFPMSEKFLEDIFLATKPNNEDSMIVKTSKPPEDFNFGKLQGTIENYKK